MEISTLQLPAPTVDASLHPFPFDFAALCDFHAMAGSTATIVVIDHDHQLLEDLRKAFSLMRFCAVNPDSPDAVPIHLLRPSCLILGPSVPILKVAHLCARFRGMESLRGIPIILVGSGGADDKAIALSAGANDYISSAATPEQIVIRVIVSLRKQLTSIAAPWRRSENAVQDQRAVTFGDLILPENSYSVVVGGRAISLTSAEFQVLRKLMKSGGSVVDTDSLRRIKTGVDETLLMSLKSRICSLRRKLRTSRVNIHTVRNAGYFLSDSK